MDKYTKSELQKIYELMCLNKFCEAMDMLCMILHKHGVK